MGVSRGHDGDREFGFKLTQRGPKKHATKRALHRHCEPVVNRALTSFYKTHKRWHSNQSLTSSQSIESTTAKKCPKREKHNTDPFQMRALASSHILDSGASTGPYEYRVNSSPSWPLCTEMLFAPVLYMGHHFQTRVPPREPQCGTRGSWHDGRSLGAGGNTFSWQTKRSPRPPKPVMAASRGSAYRPPRISPILMKRALRPAGEAARSTTGSQEFLGGRYALPRDAAMTE
jgi:hypothetical protein